MILSAKVDSCRILKCKEGEYYPKCFKFVTNVLALRHDAVNVYYAYAQCMCNLKALSMYVVWIYWL